MQYPISFLEISIVTLKDNSMNYDDERVNRTFNMFLFLLAVAFLIGVIVGIVGCYFMDLAVLESIK